MMNIRLFLYVDDKLVEARQALAAGARFSPESCGLGLEIGGVEYLKGHWNMGRVDLVTAQLEDCAQRLATGAPGIVRSGVLGWTGVPFHLFEPPETPNGMAHISRFFIEGDPDRESWFPLAGWGHRDPEELFAWVEAHKAELLTADSAIRREKPPMVHVPAPLPELIAQLMETAAVGRDVLAAVG
jgi:hypothetical protein